MERIWLARYPKGIPADVNVAEFGSVGEMFDKSVAKFGPRAAYTNMGTAISYSELDRLSRAFAAYLQSVLKLQKGARVALMMPNILQYPVALFGALRAGYTVVNCNPLYSPRELEHQLADSGAELVVIAENFASVLAKVIARTTVQHVVTTQLGDLLGFPKNLAVNFVVKSVRKMVPAWNIAGAVSFKSVLRRGATHAFELGECRSG